MITKADLIEEGRKQLDLEPAEYQELANKLSETLEVLQLITTEDVNSGDWEYNTKRGCYRSKNLDKSVSPILYKMQSSEIIELQRYPFKATAKDFTSSDSYEDDSTNTELILPDTIFYVNSKEMASLLSKIEYSGVCKAFTNKSFLNVRLVSGNETPLWLLSCEIVPPNTDCIYIDANDKSKGIKDEYKILFPQLSDRLDKIARKQSLISTTNICTDAADLAAYYRSL